MFLGSTGAAIRHSVLRICEEVVAGTLASLCCVSTDRANRTITSSIKSGDGSEPCASQSFSRLRLSHIASRECGRNLFLPHSSSIAFGHCLWLPTGRFAWSRRRAWWPTRSGRSAWSRRRAWRPTWSWRSGRRRRLLSWSWWLTAAIWITTAALATALAFPFLSGRDDPKGNDQRVQ
jgi:hypothetical protein